MDALTDIVKQRLNMWLESDAFDSDTKSELKDLVKRELSLIHI